MLLVEMKINLKKFHPIVLVFLHLGKWVYNVRFCERNRKLVSQLLTEIFFRDRNGFPKTPTVPVQIISSRRSQRSTRRLKRLSSRAVSCWARTVFCNRTPCCVDSPTPQDTACLHMSNGQGRIAPLIIYTIRGAQVRLASALDWNLCWQDAWWLMLCW